MKMNVKPIPTVDDRINEIRSLTADIVNKEILPNERTLWAWRGDSRYTAEDIDHRVVYVEVLRRS